MSKAIDKNKLNSLQIAASKMLTKFLIGATLVCCVFAIRSFTYANSVTTVKVQGQSMEPTFDNGTYINVDTNIEDIQRYDIIITYTFQDVDTPIVKRVYGLPNETIQLNGHDVYVNGKKLENVYYEDSAIFGNTNEYGNTPFTLGEDEYFVLGDNINESVDSRTKGPIKYGMVIAKYKK